MKQIFYNAFRSRLLGLCAILLAGGGASGATLEIKLGQTIERSWTAVEKAGFAYGPKQEVDEKTKETHVWLPYGSKGVYYETTGLAMTDPAMEGTGTPLAMSVDGNASGRLVYKLRFDKPIGGFRLFAGWSEWGVRNGTVGGAEYSTDGKVWTVLREIASNGLVEPLLDPATTKVEGLHTRELYLSFFSRDKADPNKDFGPNRWMKLRMGGNPAWGDRADTFFKNQLQLWVSRSRKAGDAPITDDNALAAVPTAVRAEVPLQNNVGPWGIASGAEWAGDYPKFNPMLKAAGVRWLRFFPEWQSIQPRRGTWNWGSSDDLVLNARANGIQMTGCLGYFAPWASADGGTRQGPIKNIQYWRDFVRATTSRYKNDIRHWEV